MKATALDQLAMQEHFEAERLRSQPGERELLVRSSRDHVRAGRREGVAWEAEISVSDPLARGELRPR